MTTITVAEVRTLTVNRYEPATPSLALHNAAYEAVQRAAEHLGIPAPHLAFFVAHGRRDSLGWCASAGRVWLWAGLNVLNAPHIAAHEVVHAWQLRERGSASSMDERAYREGQASRLASALCRNPHCTHGDRAATKRGHEALREGLARVVTYPTPGGHPFITDPRFSGERASFLTPVQHQETVTA